MVLSKKFKIIFAAVIFNLLFEYSIRGILGFLANPILPLILFFLYFSYFSIVEDLIRRFRIKNLQLMIVAFCFGLLPMAFLTGVIFQPPLFLGINIGRMFYINIVWWGVLQGLITFYFANRLVQRDWKEKPMTRMGWILSAGYIVALCIISILINGNLIRGPPIGYLMVLMIFFVLLIYIIKFIAKVQQNPYPFEKSLLLDLLVFGTVIVFLFIGTFVATEQAVGEGSLLSQKALQFVIAWTNLVFLGTILYYIIERKPITI